jgi:hypothetical protein
MNAGWSSRPRQAVLTVFALGLLVTYVVSVPPHLVHHLFDGDEHGHPRCPHLAQSQQTPELQADPPPRLLPPAAPAADVLPVVADALPTPDHSAESPRAPPLV